MTLTLCGVSAAPECALFPKRVTISDDSSRAIWAHFSSRGMNLPNAWVGEAVSGYTTSLALVLLTLLPCIADLGLLVYKQDGPATPLICEALSVFEIDNNMSQPPLQQMLVLLLRTVKRLSISGGTADLLQLPFNSVEHLRSICWQKWPLIHASHKRCRSLTSSVSLHRTRLIPNMPIFEP
jgi:hypothetical protein